MGRRGRASGVVAHAHAAERCALTAQSAALRSLNAEGPRPSASEVLEVPLQDSGAAGAGTTVGGEGLKQRG